MAWLDSLQDASWRGIRFGVMDSEVQRGRKVAVHEYAFSDTVWVEDLGRGTRRYEFRGFAVGDDCYDVEQQMVDAAETSGPGELVHPSLGALRVNLVNFSSGQRRELGRVVEFQLAFVEGAPSVLAPSSATSTQDAVGSAAADADTAAKGDFFDRAYAAVKTGYASVKQAVATVKSYVAIGLGVVHDARRLFNSVAGLGSLVGVNISLGRFSGGGIGSRGGIGLGGAGGALSSIGGLVSTVSRVEAGATAAIGNAVRLGTAVQSAGARLFSLAESL